MRYLIAKLFNLELADVAYGFSTERRFVHTYADGDKYVRLYGESRILDHRSPHHFVRRKSAVAPSTDSKDSP